MDIEKSTYISGLYDVYGELLTEKQKKTFKMYFFEDFSLGEIANFLKISRAAVHDQINKTIIALEKYEYKLEYYKKQKLRFKLYNDLRELSDNENIVKIIDKLEKNEE